jgi:hypothetical protein
MSTKAEECRKKAEEAEAMAAKVRDPQARETYLEIARTWRELASRPNDACCKAGTQSARPKKDGLSAVSWGRKINIHSGECKHLTTVAGDRS